MTLTQYIEHDLKQRIISGQPLPDPLTLSAISQEYRVSVMPARGAVERLVDDGFVIKNSNGRLSVSPRVPAAASKKVTVPTNTPGDCLSRVRREVIWRSLRGESDYIRIASLAERYSVGRTKAQSYLHRLSNEGLLEHHQRRGWQIRPFRSDDLDAFLDTRVALELMAFDLARDQFDLAYIDTLYKANRPKGRNQDAQLDDRLHRYWIKLANNRYVAEFFDRSGRFFDTLYHSAQIGEPLTSRLVRQHRAILGAIRNGDWDAARTALTKDIRSLKPILEDSVRRMARADNPEQIQTASINPQKASGR
jgi:DNA-binding GntR family transcriptional regulator